MERFEHLTPVDWYDGLVLNRALLDHADARVAGLFALGLRILAGGTMGRQQKSRLSRACGEVRAHTSVIQAPTAIEGILGHLRRIGGNDPHEGTAKRGPLVG